MKSDFLVALTQLAAERGLPREKVMSAIEAALVSAFKKDSVTEGHNISVRLDPGSGDIQVDVIKTVVDVVEDPLQEITVEDAKKEFNPDSKIGDTIRTQNIPNSAGRIAAQTAKQVVLQRLREAEKELVLAEYEGKEGEIFTATIQRIEPGKIVVDTGRAEAIMPTSQQVNSERYRQGAKIKVVLRTIDQDSTKGPELIVSRTSEDLLIRLFEQEVPEIYSGSVEIVAVARESGSRSKVAVRAKQQGVDPVGSCVGLRGVRIQSIVNELQGEKIDILEWDKDPNKFIQNALSPSQVLRVDVNPENGTAIAIVPDRHLSLAIGKEGQNARLAAKLCGWTVDIKSDMDVDLSELPEPVEVSTDNQEPSLDDQTQIANEIKIETQDSSEIVDKEEQELLALIAEEELNLQQQEAETEELQEELTTEDTLTAEEELLLLEDDTSEIEVESEGTEISQLPEDIWSIHRAGMKQDTNSGPIRFAEDIEDLRGGVSSRRAKPTKSNNKNKKRR